MAVTSYEVGAIFTIVDKASPILKLLSTQLAGLQGQIDKATLSLKDFGLNTGLSSLNRQLGISNKRVDSLGVGFDKTARAISTGTSTAIADLARIDAAANITKANLSSIGGSGFGRLLGGPGGASASLRARSTGGGGGAGGTGGIHFGGPGMGMPGGSHMRLNGNAALAGVGMLGYGAYLEAQMQDAIFQILYHTGQPDTPENREKFRSILQNAASSTGSSLDSVAAAAKQEVRMFKGTPGGGVDVLPEMLRAAATEARLKGTSLEESMTALIGLAHMTKEYSPDQIKKLAPAFAFLSASNPASLGGIERAASYAVPILQSGMDVDPIETLLLGTALTRAGATNTKSGTWLRNMALAAMPGTSLMSKIAFKKHEESLSELGLVDKDNNPTWFTDGKPDLIKMLDIAGRNAEKIPLTKRAAVEKQLFGAQGFGGFSLLSDPAVKEQIANLMKDMNSPEFKNRYGSFMQDYAAGSPVQAARQSWADLQNVLMNIGSVVLPPVVAGLKGVDEVLTGIQALFGNAGSFARMNKDQQIALTGITDGLDHFVSRLKSIAAFVSGLFVGGGDKPSPGTLPMHPDSRPNSLVPTPSEHHASATPVHIRSVTMLDGRVIADVISSQLAQLSSFPRQAPQGDTYGAWAPPDYNFGTA